MAGLKDFLRGGRVIELASSSWGGNRMGLVETAGSDRIIVTGGYYNFDFFSRDLIHKDVNSCSITIEKIYQNTPKGLMCIWDRSVDFVDWSTVKVDTKIQVKYENGIIYAFSNGLSSFTTTDDNIAEWSCVRLYREGV